MLKSPTHEKILSAFRLDFPISNNEAEYEALLTGLRIAKDLDVKSIQVFCDYKLVSSQTNVEFEAKDPRNVSYLQAGKDLA